MREAGQVIGPLAGLLVLAVLAWLMPALGSAERGLVAEVATAVGFSEVEPGLLTVSFLDVGQGDAIVIETPDGVQMLIDGGPDAAVLRGLGETLSFFDRTIDVVVATHPDLDHVGGLPDVLARYEVDTVLLTSNEGDTEASTLFRQAVAAEGAEVVFATAGQTIALGASTTFTILSPAGDPALWESNNSSIVGQLRYGEIEFLFTGDAGQGIENYLVSEHGTALASEVLKLGHHGSDTSSSEQFLEAVQPRIAIVSAGADNSYGHPDPDVMARTEAVGATIVNTAEQGTITLRSDGEAVWVDN